MSKPSAKQVTQLAKQLSPQDRADLFEQLAELPDSPVKLLPRREQLPQPTVDQTKALQDIQLHYEVRNEQGKIIYSFEGREVFRLEFNAENYADVFFEKFKTKEAFLKLSDEQRKRVYQAVRDVLKEEGMTVTDRRLRSIESQALHELGLKILKDNLLATAKRMGENLPQVAAMIFPKVTQASLFAGANQLRDTLQVPEQKLSETEIRNALQGPEWQYLKRIIGITPPVRGGARNIKHAWSDAELDCLARTYQELAPMWLEAKQIARAAQKSRVGSRSKSWRDEVLRAFPDLPADLLDRFEHLRADDAKPSDIAIVHAKIKCGVTEAYSARELRDKIKSRNLKPKSRTSTKSHKTRKFKTKT
jgi:hypothetical protein